MLKKKFDWKELGIDLLADSGSRNAWCGWNL